MSDRAEFYGRFPDLAMREPVPVPVPRSSLMAHGVFRRDWTWKTTRDFKAWILYVAPQNRPRSWDYWAEARFMVWFDDFGQFVQANGLGYVFYDMHCFFRFVEGRPHDAGEVCGRAV